MDQGSLEKELTALGNRIKKLETIKPVSGHSSDLAARFDVLVNALREQFPEFGKRYDELLRETGLPVTTDLF